MEQDREINRFSKKQMEYLDDYEVLRDYKGTAYQISERYLKDQIDQRSASEDVKRKLAYSIIQDGFKMLTQQQRKVMSLLVNGHTEREIATSLDISQTAVHRLKQRASKKMKKYIPEFIKEKEEKGDK